MENILLFSLLMTVLSSSLANQLQPLTVIIPKGTESVNGSLVGGGCDLNITESFCSTGNESFINDGNIPMLNTTDPNWASELVTVRKNSDTKKNPYDHVVLTFAFQSPVSLTSINMSLFNCPQWSIGAPNITVYAKKEATGLFSFDAKDTGTIFLRQTQGIWSSCDSLVPVTIPLKKGKLYQIWYIVVSFEPQPATDWVHVGEVQFFNGSLPPLSTGTDSTTSMVVNSGMDLNSEENTDLNSEENENTAIIVGGIVAGIFILILVLTVIFLGVFLLKKMKNIRAKNIQNPVNLSKQQEENEMNIYTQKEPMKGFERMQQDNNKIATFSTSKDSQSYNGSIGYTEVTEKIFMKEDSSSDDNSLYDDITTSSVMKASSFLAHNRNQDEALTHRSSENLQGDITDEVGGVAIYSDVKKKKAPGIPSKSPALEMYLMTHTVS